MKPERPLLHAIRMVRRNFKSYAMLSITIALSFSVLLGYLLLSDSNHYNSFKEIFSTPNQVVMAYTYDSRTEILQRLIAQVKQEDPDCYAYSYVTSSAFLPQYDGIAAETVLLPANETVVFQEMLEERNSILYAKQVQVLEGKSFPLKTGEAVINRSAYDSLFGDTPLPATLTVTVPLEDGSQKLFSLSVVGIAADTNEAPFSCDLLGRVTGTVKVYTPATLLRPVGKQAQGKQTVFFYSQQPEKARQLCEQYKKVLSSTCVIHAVCTAQAEANEVLLSSAQTKTLICVMLLLILGVNLYGCFSNALNDRRFEIGVKRAIGATPMAVIRQFLTEGFCVTLLNIFASVAIVAELAIVYKCWQHFQGTEWIVYLSPYSAGAFLVCSLGMTVIFSLLFAYQSEQVETASQLKAE